MGISHCYPLCTNGLLFPTLPSHELRALVPAALRLKLGDHHFDALLGTPQAVVRRGNETHYNAFSRGQVLLRGEITVHGGPAFARERARKSYGGGEVWKCEK
jgi:hypothetical protein